MQLTGEWRYHDPERSGESYLDVRAVVVVEPGKRLEEGPDWWVMVAGIVLVAGAGLLWMTRPRED